MKEEDFKTITLQGMGKAITKCVSVAEIIKRRVPDLHQQIFISSSDVVDVYHPNEVGLDM